MLPNFIIGGAPKSGTSSLYYWLSAHPDVCSSRAKETFFFHDKVNRFNEKANCIEHGLGEYETHFSHCQGHKVVFEASAPYIFQSNALREIPQLNSSPKVLFILREPSARLLSKYRYNRYKLHNTTVTFESYCSDRSDFPGGKHYREGVYSTYLSAWKDALGSDRLKVMTFEHLMTKPESFMQELCDFLAIPSHFYDQYSFPKHNETFATRSGVIHKFAVDLLPWVPQSWVQRLAPIYQGMNRSKMPTVSTDERQVVDRLKHLYAEDRKKLKALFPELDLTPWMR
jgi:hypothetical protein